MKLCKACKVLKAETEYRRNPKVKCGLHGRCRDCEREYQRQWYAANREHCQKRQKAWIEANPGKWAAKVRKWQANNPEAARASKVRWNEANKERCRERERRFREQNPEAVKAKLARRLKREKASTPSWVDRAELVSIYEMARQKTAETGVKHEVDHIIPLAGRNVSGLTVPWNLRVVPAIVNGRKGTSFEEGDVICRA